MKDVRFLTKAEMVGERSVNSHCCYCSMQCGVQFHFHPDKPRMMKASPRNDFPVAAGKLCQKGFTSHEHAFHSERLKSPLLRKNGRLEQVEWEEAYEWVTKNFRRLKRKYGNESISVYGGGSLTNEESYLLGKFARIALQTPYIDYNGRFCMSSAATAANVAFGLDRGMSFPLEDLRLADCILIAGANIADCQPTMLPYLLDAKKRGAKLVVIDPRYTSTAKLADVHLPVRPGTDLLLVYGLLQVLFRENWINSSFITERTVGVEQVRNLSFQYSLGEIANKTGLSVEQIEDVAAIYGLADKGIVLTARGVEQHTKGVDTVLNFINLVLVKGNIGRAGAGYGAVTGQGNGQGGREHGQKADQLPGYRRIDDPRHRREVAKVWGIPPRMLPGKGVSANELFQKIELGEIKGMLIMGSNPVVSNPNNRKVITALKKLELLVVIDFLPSETAQMADVVLPSASFLEDEGTMTNLEGRVIHRNAVLPAQGEAKVDWQILCDLAERMKKGKYFTFHSAEEIFDELGRASHGGLADYSGMNYQRIKENSGLFWPCPDHQHPGTPRLFHEKFAHEDGKARMVAVNDRAVGEMVDFDYPYFLTTGRVPSQYLTGVQTRRTVRLNTRTPDPLVEIHPEVADNIGIHEKEKVKLVSRRGEAVFQVRITDTIRPDTVFVPFHWGGDRSVNQLTNDVLDPKSKMPEFKVCAVAIQPIREPLADDENVVACKNDHDGELIVNR